MPDYDAIIIGAGHNGLTAGTVLAKEGMKVAILEKTNYVGGMAATKELFPGYKHSVGAWAFIVYHDLMLEKLELEKYGFDLITPKTSFCVFGHPEDPPFIAYNDPEEMLQHLLRDHGEDAVQSLFGMLEYFTAYADTMEPYLWGAPESIEKMIAMAPDAKTREAIASIPTASCVEMLRKFFPDPNRHRTIQGSMTAMTIDGTHMGPYTPGAAASMAYHYTAGGVANLFRMPRGGIGQLSQALLRQYEDHGGEVILKAIVDEMIIEDGAAKGVKLRNGDTLSAPVVLSTVDARTTYMDMIGEDNLPSDVVNQVKEIKYKNGYMQIHLTLDEAPEFTGQLEYAMEDNIRWLLAYIKSPQHVQSCWESYQRGEIPEDPLSYCYIPSLVDPSVAPEGKHTATFFAHYFSPDIPRKQHNEMRDRMADRVINQVAQHSPNFEKSITNRIVLTHQYFEKTFGAPEGDFSQGLLHPDQLWDRRPLRGYADYTTPVPGAFMGGAACHPGPGVTSLPGWNSAHKILETVHA